MESIKMIGVLLFAVSFSGTIIFAIFSSLKTNANRRQILENSGFSPVTNPPAAFTEYIITLYNDTRSSRSHIKLKHLFHKHLDKADLYVFNLIMPGEDAQHYEVIAYVSPLLRLPRLLIDSVEPENYRNSCLGKWIDSWIKTMKRYNRRVSLPDFPEFETRYKLSVTNEEDEANVKQIFTSTAINGLLNAEPHYSLLAWGDAITERSRLKMKTDTTQEETQSVIEDALSVFRLFENRDLPKAVSSEPLRAYDSHSGNIRDHNDLSVLAFIIVMLLVMFAGFQFLGLAVKFAEKPVRFLFEEVIFRKNPDKPQVQDMQKKLLRLSSKRWKSC
ncbi:MAG TPA: hypothetical protein DCQ37_01150 [Desulfobacteraceae bacterium]|nr:hypothetical protein [Desulfobacteraceae bacterium]